MKIKRVSAIVSIVMILTMVFSAGSVFAYGGHPPLGKVYKIVPSQTYIQLSEGEETHVSITSVHERGAVYANLGCKFIVDHEDVIDVDKGSIKAKKKGVATITVQYDDVQAQVVVEVV